MIARRIFNQSIFPLFVARGSAGAAGMWGGLGATGEFLGGRIDIDQPGKDPVPEERQLAHEVDTMEEKARQADPALEAALAEELLLWEAIHDPELKATVRVVAYARWRAAVKRLKGFATSPRPRGGAE
jgi:hypothetical protein